jgi:Rps23 Pro-64 3,4-dihydroxylase Tpa1-like proline 4-hydroxylase
MNLPLPHRQSYSTGKPFPHLVIDNVFDDLSVVIKEWPKIHEFDSSNKNQQLKSYTTSESKMNWVADFIKINFQSQEFILFLEELTGIKGLVMDIRGGYALHETMVGGKLSPHLDYIVHNITGLQHRVNAILYLDDVDGGGELELYEQTPAYGGHLIRKVSIAPRFNRMVIFNIDTKAFHGHPNPVTGNKSRKSIALNYFSLPDKDAVKQDTIFATTRKNIFRQFIPPIIYKLIKKLKAGEISVW